MIESVGKWDLTRTPPLAIAAGVLNNLDNLSGAERYLNLNLLVPLTCQYMRSMRAFDFFWYMHEFLHKKAQPIYIFFLR
jgi:hypothetical protein